jgi:hypothetical protein
MGATHGGDKKEYAMEWDGDLIRFSQVIPDPDTGHAWVLRANRATADMEFECVRCGRIERLVTIEQWNVAVRHNYAYVIINHKAAWKTVVDACPKAGAPIPKLHLERGPLVAAHGAHETDRR